MSNTRHAKSGTPPAEHGFCSSTEYERGLLGNTVAMRCSILDDPEDRELLLALQYLSWQPGGLKKVSADLLAQFPEHLSTPMMRKLGMKLDQVYTSAQTKMVRD